MELNLTRVTQSSALKQDLSNWKPWIERQADKLREQFLKMTPSEQINLLVQLRIK